MTPDSNSVPENRPAASITVGPDGPDGAEEGFVPDPGRWRILTVLLVSIFMSLVSVSIVNVVLPSIQIGLGASDSDLQWVLSGYALTFGVVLVAAGRAGDILGRGPLFIAGVALFTLSSVAAGLAPDPLSLNITRFLQGLGSGLLNPQAVGMIQQYFRGAERGRAYGALGSVIGISVAIGPLLGGMIIELVGVQEGWRWTFLVNVPVGILAIVLALMWFKPQRAGARSETATADRGLDPLGAVLLGLAVLALLLPFVERGTGPWIWLLLPGGAALLALWAWWEHAYRSRGRSPMVDLRIFRTHSFSNGSVIAGLYFMGVTSVWVLVALYIQQGLGGTALEAGLIGLPAALLGAYASHWSGRRVLEHGRQSIVVGILCALLGLGLTIAVIQLEAAGMLSIWWMLLTLSFIGMAQGLIITPNQTLTLAEVPLEYSGSAGGVLQTSQRIGTAVGIAVITAVAFSVQAQAGWTAAITAGLCVTAVSVVATLVIAVSDARRGSRVALLRSGS
ncbi:MFS transporter [Arthrobacter sp. NPDC089319]|uniref:MFS transporter n=1 Tax=Arthrobacter sp. NPDC089319 TaxID=3155915 RepID=UPI003426F003